MKSKPNTYKLGICIAIAFQIVFYINPLFSKSLKDTHLRKGIWGEVPNQYEFNNTSNDVGFITGFPWRQLNNEIGVEKLNYFNIDYRIHTSIEDAELTMVEHLDMSNLLMNNIIDKPLPQGPIGNNCWYQLSAGIIRFLRNNVYVSISKKDSESGMDANSIEFLARTIDTILMQSNTVKYPSLIPAPKIHSINITSTLPENFDKTIEVKVNASDDKNQKLLYRKFATGFGIVSETGELKIAFNKNTDVTEDSTKARVKIWVWNEDNIVASSELDIPF
jgi:hypothetical protein